MSTVNVEKATAIAKKGMSFEIVQESQLFPPLDILNLFLQCGIDDAASEVAIQWKPFSLSRDEYEDFFERCKNLYGQLEIDRLESTDYSDWFSAAIDYKP